MSSVEFGVRVGGMGGFRVRSRLDAQLLVLVPVTERDALGQRQRLGLQDVDVVGLEALGPVDGAHVDDAVALLVVGVEEGVQELREAGDGLLGFGLGFRLGLGFRFGLQVRFGLGLRVRVEGTPQEASCLRSGGEPRRS